MASAQDRARVGEQQRLGPARTRNRAPCRGPADRRRPRQQDLAPRGRISGKLAIFREVGISATSGPSHTRHEETPRSGRGPPRSRDASGNRREETTGKRARAELDRTRQEQTTRPGRTGRDKQNTGQGGNGPDRDEADHVRRASGGLDRTACGKEAATEGQPERSDNRNRNTDDGADRQRGRQPHRCFSAVAV